MYSINFHDDGYRTYSVNKNKSTIKNNKPNSFTVTNLGKNDVLKCISSHFAETIHLNNNNVDRLQIMSCDSLIDTCFKALELAGLSKRNTTKHIWISDLRDKLKKNDCYEKLKNAQLTFHKIKNKKSHEAYRQQAIIDAMHAMIESVRRNLINFLWNNKLSYMIV